MTDATDMPKLQHNASALLMHGGGYLAPAVDLRLVIDAGRALIALPLLRNLACLGNDQPGGSALGVIFCGHFAGHEARTGAVASERRHDDPV